MISLEDFTKMELKIIAICYDNNLKEQLGQILSYYSRRTKTLNTLNLFDEDKNALRDIKLSLGEISIDSCDDIDMDQKEIHKINAMFITSMDNMIREMSGKENFIISDLRNRKKLYTDKKFFEEIKNLYLTLITPNIPFYDDAKVNAAFEKYSNKLNVKDDIDELLESISSGKTK